MGIFDESIQTDATFLMDADGPTELVLVKAPGDADWREIYAFVNRRPPERIEADGSVTAPLMTLCVANDAVKGIATASFQGGGNVRVKLGRKKNGTVEEFGLYLPPIGSIRAHNAGLFSLDVK